MEIYSKTTRFALACNASDKIIGELGMTWCPDGAHVGCLAVGEWGLFDCLSWAEPCIMNFFV